MEFINNLKLSQKLFLVLFLVVVLINILLWAFKIQLNFDTNSDCYEFGYTGFNIQGEVIEKLHDRSNHNFPLIKVKLEDTIYTFCLARSRKIIYNYIKVSDSVFNLQEEMKIRIKRKDFDTVIDIYRISNSTPIKQKK